MGEDHQEPEEEKASQDNSTKAMTASTSSSTIQTAATTATTTSSSSFVVTPERSKRTKKKQKTASEWKEVGNRAYTSKQYPQALQAYDSGLQALDEKDDEDGVVWTSLLSNRAQVLIKLEDYGAAEESCTRILEQPPGRPTTTSNLYKVWYRRAQARENLAKQALQQQQQQQQHSAPNNKSNEWIQLAKTDLQSALRAVEEDEQISKKERDMAKQSVLEVASRIQRLLSQQQQQQKQQPPAAASKPKKTPSKKSERAVAVPRTLPPAKQQKQDVMRLLLSRFMGLQQKQFVGAAHGEAIFLLDWHWWCRFCFWVDLFGRHDPKVQQKALQYFPPGTILPEEPLQKKQTDDDDDDDDDDEADHGPPGPIDNRHLFLLDVADENDTDADDDDQPTHVRTTQQAFNEQWYSPPQQQPGGDTIPALKPNLVRGYHYEIIPREVYNALVQWYGELTPSIWRRALRDPRTGRVTIPLYLLAPPPSNTDNFYNINCCGACQAPVDVMRRCKLCLSVYYCDRACQETHWAFHKQECRLISANKNQGDQQQPQPEQPIRIRPLSHGNIGLNNLGNTCFMNSALQCLSHATPLTRHFLSGRFKQDVNTSNPLGTGGRLAYAYEGVMKELWMRAGQQRSYSPTALKRAIAQFAPRFAGCLQHDAQEFLAYLLDGLHEDLNRIRKAPYVEMPDVNEGHDMTVEGARAWDAHKRRNDSLVMDSFYGQFKSTCVCPQCNRVSVSFDAFNHVSLEIPQQQNAIITLGVCVIPASSKELPGFSLTRFAVTLRRNNPVWELKQELFKMTGIPPTRLHLCEIYEREINRIIRDQEIVGVLQPTDILIAYEADPFEGPAVKPCYHAVLRHKVLSQQEVEEEETEDRFIGVPLLMSWPVDIPCREMWEILWNAVQDKVDEHYRPRYKETIEFRLHDGRGKGVAVFPDLLAPQQDGTEKRTSLIPRHSDDTLLDILGKEAIDCFLSIYAEWTDLGQREGETSDDGAIEEGRFLAVVNHQSWMDYVAKREAQGETKGVSLDQCFETFVKPERLDERNMWYCSNCKEHVQAMKTMELWRLPNILVVHLKRFEFKNVLRRDKLSTLVDFPLDGLDMSAHCGQYCNTGNFVVDGSVPAEYDLFAVVNHYGRMGFGHYTAFARNWNERGISEDWYLFDDSRVQLIGSSGESVVSNAAYVLFYRRRTWN